jgi:NADH:ubiquinone oxidoreductase subunit E
MNPQELKERLQPLIGDYPHPQLGLVPSLHLLLESEHPMSNETLEVLAELCGVEAHSVAEIIGYYAVFQNKQPAHSSLCLGLPCYVSGSKEILDEVKSGSTLDDGRIKDVNVSPCLGHCYAAPVMKLEDGTICKVRTGT